MREKRAFARKGDVTKIEAVRPRKRCAGDEDHKLFIYFNYALLNNGNKAEIADSLYMYVSISGLSRQPSGKGA
jgi:hypothetical protein